MSSQLILNQVIKQIFAFSNTKFLPSQLRKFSTNSEIDQLKKEDLDKYDVKLPEYMDLHYLEEDQIDLLQLMISNMTVLPNFITSEEEENLMKEVEPILKRRRYEFDHWDNAIHGFRETEHKNWNSDNEKVLKRVQEVAFDKASAKDVFEHVHVLDLSKDGKINPHVDSVRFCGHTIAGLSLISNSVMRLTRALEGACDDLKNNKKNVLAIDIYLERRSLYIMRHEARYKFAHEILGKENSLFKNKVVTRDRRVSVICRNHP